MKNLIEALKLIKEICDDTMCPKCPLSDTGDECLLQQDCPSNWKILNEPITVTKVII